ncbi:MAG: isochorismatase family protein [Nocardioides sp.]
MARALIVVDVQNDFCEGGTLPVTGGAEVAFDIGALLHRWVAKGPDAPAYDVVVASKDHHIDPGEHWAREPDFRETWPVHCKVGTDGEAFHPNLDPQPFDAIFLKGNHEAAYSAFEGRTVDGAALTEWLQARGVTEVEICGIATDHCVRATALDAASAGFATTVLLDLCAGVAPDTTEAALSAMAETGIDLVRT